ncbi:phosphatase PAP2 family protein [Serratia sp. JSRIV002]|jgi:membrane-associated phospholipid phosphatase|uniref:Phosphatase PAP2 family protein n=1 Tax=Serratia fonticola TaxID=47917 RepID=A0AAE7EJJ8_SERFO|nr:MULTISPECIES: phosphatase PAP2 family protein [Serratia]AYM89653.1 phosphatase PAP2 family protein [Serratia sp. 3ACOL1]MBL5859080.1 phosphatase PAP2 family protein [Serratia fonticola]MDK2378531.1 phosphatase PAP2 family protein [Serratia fonticola]NBJ33799.1 phosphatase PAP2 family protein [Serratia fonticola]NCG54166.1 phosphatase PAP2 family protein [Serratia fonticola]
MNWHFLTFFGDSMLLLPCAAIVFIILLLSPTSRKPTWQWMLLFGGVGAVVCVSKLAFMGWGIGSRHWDFTGFSGHSALSASIWPVLLWLLCGRFSSPVRRTAVIVGYLLAAVVGYSRLVIHAHSTSEVITGLALGFIVSSTFLMLQRGTQPPRLSYRKIAVTLALPLVLINSGTAAPTQGLLERIAVTIAPVEKPFVRADLHKKPQVSAPQSR